MMNTPLLEQMKSRLLAAKGQWPVVCINAGVDYVWLTKVMQGHIKDPGVNRVERVLTALDRMNSTKQAA
jgi:hypothetical protein